MRYTTQQNGMLERLNRVIMKRVRCLLSDAILEQKLWTKVVAYIVYTLNRSPHTSLRFLTPKEEWTKHPPNMNDLKVFGCVRYVHQHQGKQKARATKCMFVGFIKGVKDFKIWHLIDKKFIISRDVHFKENEMVMKGKGK